MSERSERRGGERGGHSPLAISSCVIQIGQSYSVQGWALAGRRVTLHLRVMLPWEILLSHANGHSVRSTFVCVLGHSTFYRNRGHR